jgi:biotin transport system ATP-binding protein
MTEAAMCAGLTYRYDRADRAALSGVSTRIRAGDLAVLAGVNGSGKSTLLHVLAGIFPPASGALRVLGLDLPREARRLRGRVALVPQDPDAYILGALVEEDVLLGLPEGDAAARARARNLLEGFGLGGLMDRPVQTLSFGQRRKLCLASALAADPGLLLVDEPLAGLDYPACLAMRAVLARNRAAGLTQIVVAHDLDLLADLADSLIMMVDGRVEAQGPPEEVYPLLLAAGVRPPCRRLGPGEPPWMAPPERALTGAGEGGRAEGKK